MEWPPYSPDISPIEHLLDELDKRIRKRQNPPTNRAHLIAALTQELNNIPLRRINVLMDSTGETSDVTQKFLLQYRKE